MPCNRRLVGIQLSVFDVFIFNSRYETNGMQWAGEITHREEDGGEVANYCSARYLPSKIRMRNWTINDSYAMMSLIEIYNYFVGRKMKIEEKETRARERERQIEINRNLEHFHVLSSTYFVQFAFVILQYPNSSVGLSFLFSHRFLFCVSPSTSHHITYIYRPSARLSLRVVGCLQLKFRFLSYLDSQNIHRHTHTLTLTHSNPSRSTNFDS